MGTPPKATVAGYKSSIEIGFSSSFYRLNPYLCTPNSGNNHTINPERLLHAILAQFLDGSSVQSLKHRFVLIPYLILRLYWYVDLKKRRVGSKPLFIPPTPRLMLLFERARVSPKPRFLHLRLSIEEYSQPDRDFMWKCLWRIDNLVKTGGVTSLMIPILRFRSSHLRSGLSVARQSDWRLSRQRELHPVSVPS
jgi:hypothetical protein